MDKYYTILNLGKDADLDQLEQAYTNFKATNNHLTYSDKVYKDAQKAYFVLKGYIPNKEDAVKTVHRASEPSIEKEKVIDQNDVFQPEIDNTQNLGGIQIKHLVYFTAFFFSMVIIVTLIFWDLDGTNFPPRNTNSYLITRPFTGDRTYQNQIKTISSGFGTNQLYVLNDNKSDGVVFLIDSYSGKIYDHFYIRKGDDYLLEGIADGNYSFKYYAGNDWTYDLVIGKYNGRFTEGEVYTITKEDNALTFLDNLTVRITLFTIKNGNIKIELVDEEDFFDDL